MSKKKKKNVVGNWICVKVESGATIKKMAKHVLSGTCFQKCALQKSAMSHKSAKKHLALTCSFPHDVVI